MTDPDFFTGNRFFLLMAKLQVKIDLKIIEDHKMPFTTFENFLACYRAWPGQKLNATQDRETHE